MKAVLVIAALAVLAGLSVSGSAGAHTITAPPFVIADPTGNVDFTYKITAASTPASVSAEYVNNVVGTCSSGHGDGFCSSTVPAGATEEFVGIGTRLCNPDVGGRFRLMIVFCDGERDTAYIDVYPYGTASVGSGVATALSLRNYPNPVRGRTTFDFVLPKAGQVSLTVYDLLGRRVATVFDQDRVASAQSVDWSARRDDGSRLEPGLYLARLVTASGSATRRFIVAH